MTIDGQNGAPATPCTPGEHHGAAVGAQPAGKQHPSRGPWRGVVQRGGNDWEGSPVPVLSPAIGTATAAKKRGPKYRPRGLKRAAARKGRGSSSAEMGTAAKGGSRRKKKKNGKNLPVDHYRGGQHVINRMQVILIFPST